MQNKFKRAVALFAAGCLCISTGYFAASAAAVKDGYNGRSTEFVYLQNGVEEFLNTENFFGAKAYNEKATEIYMPGATITGSADVSNENNSTVKIYLYAATTSLDKYEAYAKANNISDRTPAQLKSISEKLIKEIQLKVEYTDANGSKKTIYNGKMSGAKISTSSMLTQIDLGEYDKGDKGKLEFKLDIPSNLGNEYNDAVAMIDWVFTCTQIEPPETPEEPPKEPPAPSPGTGEDAVPLIIGAAVCALSAAAIIIVLFRNRKKEDDECNVG